MSRLCARAAVVYVLVVAAVVLAAIRLPALGDIATTLIFSLPIAAVVLLLASMTATDDRDAANYRLTAAEQVCGTRDVVGLAAVLERALSAQ